MIKDKNEKAAYKERLIEVLSEESQKWWAEKTNASPSIISSNWCKGNFPGLEKLIKFLKIKDISANWLLFGIGPKHVNQLDEKNVKENQEYNRKTQRSIIKIEEKNIKLENEVAQLKAELKQLKLHEKIKLTNIKDGSVYERNILPVMTLFRMIADLATKAIEVQAEKGIDSEKYREIVEWVVENFDSRKLETASKLKELDKVIEKKS